MTTLLAAYHHQLAMGELRADPAQERAVAALQDLCDLLAALPDQPRGIRIWRRNASQPALRGLYLHGPVGRGKSMLMDMFFAKAPQFRKRRVHFHAFMQEVHRALHAWRQDVRHGDDPLPKIAQDIAAQYRLLCFDEFQVTDIADAMILARLFEALFQEGVVLVATSNAAPDDLYAGGLQRAHFLPFIALLKRHVAVLEVAGAQDHRLAFLRGHQVYFTPLGSAASAELAALFAGLTHDAAPRPVTLALQGREVRFARAAHGVLWSSFAELCGRPLGGADYLMLAGRFRAVLLDGVPQFRAEQRNETMRFVTLVDVLYEARVKLAVAAQASPDELCPDGLHEQMFRRTVSRLHEMQGAAYLAAPQNGA